MTIKSYFANAVEAAIRQAHAELGPEAMLIESRAAAPEMRREGRFEVVFGVLENAQEEPKPKKRLRRPGARISRLRSRCCAARSMSLARCCSQLHSPPPLPSRIEKVRNELIASDLDPFVAGGLIDAAEAIWLNPASGARKPDLREVVEDCVRGKIQTATDLNCASGRGNIVAFVGPPGAGKTTALAKVAVQHCLAKRRSVRIVSVDTERVGGHELLRAYSSVLGIGFAAANSLSSFQEALDQGPEKTCVLIDTPGFARAEMAAARELATVLGRIPGREVHLVLPASMKRADASEYSDSLALFKPGRLLFTKLDETLSVGSMLSETLRLAIPLSFFSIGQAVPEDLEIADPEPHLENVSRRMRRRPPAPPKGYDGFQHTRLLPIRRRLRR